MCTRRALPSSFAGPSECVVYHQGWYSTYVSACIRYFSLNPISAIQASAHTLLLISQRARGGCCRRARTRQRPPPGAALSHSLPLAARGEAGARGPRRCGGTSGGGGGQPAMGGRKEGRRPAGAVFAARPNLRGTAQRVVARSARPARVQVESRRDLCRVSKSIDDRCSMTRVRARAGRCTLTWHFDAPFFLISCSLPPGKTNVPQKQKKGHGVHLEVPLSSTSWSSREVQTAGAATRRDFLFFFWCSVAGGFGSGTQRAPRGFWRAGTAPPPAFRGVGFRWRAAGARAPRRVDAASAFAPRDRAGFARAASAK